MIHQILVFFLDNGATRLASPEVLDWRERLLGAETVVGEMRGVVAQRTGTLQLLE